MVGHLCAHRGDLDLDVAKEGSPRETELIGPTIAASGL
jgi:hypothetical protein